MQVSYPKVTSRIPRRMPLPEAAALLRIRPRPHSVSDSLPIFDAPRTFPSQIKREPCDNLVNHRHTSLNRVGLSSV